MKQTYALVLFIFMSTSNILISQNSIQINFDAQYHLPTDAGNGFMILQDIKGADSINYEGITYQIKYPDDFFVQDTAVAFNYFTGWVRAKIKNTTMFLLGNYSSNRPVMYVDYNHNLDFSDDGQPIVFDQDSSAVVYLRNSENTSSFFPIKFFYPKLKAESKSKVESMFSNSAPDIEGATILGIDYWLGDMRMNYKIANTWINGKMIMIGLHDYDCNGLYNDKEEDRILIGDHKAGEVSERLSEGATVLTDTAQIEIAGLVYDIEEVNPSGQFIRLVKSKRDFIQPLNIGNDVSNLEINLLSGETKAIKELQEKGKYILLDFWGDWCKGCIEGLPKLKGLEETNNKSLQIIGLNFGDEKDKIEKHISKHNINWTMGYADIDLMDKLRIDGFPTYMLLDTSGRILIMNGKVEEIKMALIEN